MRYLIFLLPVLMLSACGSLSTVETADQIKTTYDTEGKPVSTISTPKAVGHKYTEYRGAIADVATSRQAQTIAIVTAITTAMAPTATDTDATAAYKQAMAMMALNSLGQNLDMARDIAAVQYGKDGYDVADTAIGGAVKIATFGVGAWAGTQIVDSIVDGAGTRIATKITGDSNSTTTETEQTSTRSVTHANTTGDSSPSTVATDQQTSGTAQQVEAEEEETEEEAVVEEEGTEEVIEEVAE